MNSKEKGISVVLLSISSAMAVADIEVSGTVEPVMNLEVNQTQSLSDLDLSEDTNGKLIAVATENSNLSAGYQIIINTENNFKLVSDDDASAPVEYRLIYGTTDVKSAKDRGEPAYRSEVISNGQTHQNIIHELKIAYQGTPEQSLIAGNYSDSIHIQIQAN